jgi:hypothetical protein
MGGGLLRDRERVQNIAGHIPSNYWLVFLGCLPDQHNHASTSGCKLLVVRSTMWKCRDGGGWPEQLQ